MYKFKVETKKSDIDGLGVFALEKIHKDSIVWIFDKNHDKTLSIKDFDLLSEKNKKQISRIAYLSKTSNLYVFPPENDPAIYTNHSENNNLSVHYDLKISDEPFFVANRDIEVGEEVTNNYLEFDEKLKDNEFVFTKDEYPARAEYTRAPYGESAYTVSNSSLKLSVGKLIVIEGCDAAGKETQTKMLKEFLFHKGFKAASLDFPRYRETVGGVN